MKSTAAELNTLLAAFKAHELGRPFGAKFAGVDAITGTRFTPGTSIRMLCGKALLTRPLLGGSGVDVLSLACECQRRFVDAPEGDGVYYVVNGQGAATRVEIQGERAYVFALRKRVKTHLDGMPDGEMMATLSRYAREHFLAESALANGRSIADVAEFVRWLGDRMGIDV